MIGYYASVMDGPRRGLLLGPFADLEAAAAKVERARQLAESVDDRAVWYAYGTARVEAGTLPQGRLNALAAEQPVGRCANMTRVNNAMTRRAIRVDDPTWDAADARAKGESRTVSDIVRIALRDYAEGRYDASPIRRNRQ